MNVGVLKFSQQLAEELTVIGRHSAARSYESSVKSLIKFAGKEDLTFSELNQSLLKEYEQFLLNIGRTRNTVSLYLRMLRSICNKAILSKIAVPENLFANLLLGMDQCEIHMMSLQVFARLAKLDLGNKLTSLGFARDLFMLSFYLRGIPFADMAYLRKDDIKSGVLYYRRKRSRRGVVVALESSARSIIERYSQYTADSPYLLPILSGSEEDECFCYQNGLRWYNRSLNSLSQKLKLECSLTTYAPRHSWATTASRQGFPVSVINESLGGNVEQVICHHLTTLEDRILYRSNQKVISNIESFKEDDLDMLRVRKLNKRVSRRVSRKSDINFE